MASRMRLQSVVAFGLATLGFAAMVAGCDTSIKAGDYRVFKMDFAGATKSGGCYFPDKGPSANTASDSDTTVASAIWVITADTVGNLYLDLGDHTLQGAATETGYAFTATKVDVEFEQDDPKKTRRTVTVVETVTATVDGKGITGEATVETSFACKGTGCSAIPTCTVGTKFAGSEVDDVQLQRDVK